MTAFDSIRDTYDIDTLREIRDHGCVSGVAHDHIYYSDTSDFYDEYQDEIVNYIEDVVGAEVLTEIFQNNYDHLDAYKNDVVWSYIELVACLLVDQYEDTTCQELSDLDELASTPWGQQHLEIITA
mgnify:CR=1 FL=1